MFINGGPVPDWGILIWAGHFICGYVIFFGLGEGEFLQLLMEDALFPLYS